MYFMDGRPNSSTDETMDWVSIKISFLENTDFKATSFILYSMNKKPFSSLPKTEWFLMAFFG